MYKKKKNTARFSSLSSGNARGNLTQSPLYNNDFPVSISSNTASLLNSHVALSPLSFNFDSTPDSTPGGVKRNKSFDTRSIRFLQQILTRAA